MVEQGLHVLLDRVRGCRPRSRGELRAYVKAFLGISVPDQRVCVGHDSPMDYLAWAFLGEEVHHEGHEDHEGIKDCGRGEEVHHEGHEGHEGVKDSGSIVGVNRDCIVWANRGGGKTQLGAVATLLDCLFLPGCAVRILGGSQEQSQRMYEYLRAGIRHGYEGQLSGRLTASGCDFLNGSGVAVLSQSESSVRGHHVQRLRCDEVELFEREVWQAAQFVPHSANGIAAQMEVFSTMHRPYGLMHELIGKAKEKGTRVFRWCLWEVIEKCVDRSCSSCPLWEDCRGCAKQANGFYKIEDAIAQKRRSSRTAWRSEMLCEQPNREDLVFPEFHPRLHVVEVGYQADRPLYRSLDFGFSNPFACLFIQMDDEGRVYVIDEHVKSRTTLAEHARLLLAQYPQKVTATYCDPAGKCRHEITGTAITQELAALGIPTQSCVSRVLDGVERMRQYLSPAAGGSKLFVSSRCEQLIRAFGSLRYERKEGRLSEQPKKDGVHDHVMDALRYFFVNRFGRSGAVREKRY